MELRFMSLKKIYDALSINIYGFYNNLLYFSYISSINYFRNNEY